MTGTKTAKFEAGKAAADKKGGGKAGSPAKPCPLATLKVRVLREKDPPGENFDCEIRIQKSGGAESTASEPCEAEHVFAKLDPGKYEVSAKPPEGSGYSFKKPVTVTLPASSEKSVDVQLLKAELVSVSPDADQEQYVNLKKDSARPADGRVLEVEARLDEEKKGVRVYFGLKAGPDNVADPHPGSKAKIGASALTDKKGVAKAKLTCSTYGADLFQVRASLCKDLDHPSAKVVESSKVEVWRKLWFQLTKLKGFGAPKPASSVGAWEKVFVRFEEGAGKEFERADLPEKVRARTFYPEWQVEPGGGDDEAAIIGAHNKKHFYKLYQKEKDKPLKAHLIATRLQWDAAGTTALQTFTMTTPARKLTFTDAEACIVSPALEGALIVTGKWKTEFAPIKSGTLKSEHVTIPKPRANLAEVEVTLPAECPAPSPGKGVKVQLSLRYAKSYLGESSGHNILVVYDSADVQDYNDTITHEVGHSGGQTPKPGKQAKKLAKHPHYYEDIHGGQGPHCSTDSGGGKGTLVDVSAQKRKTWDGRKIKKVYQTGVCVMFHQYDANCIHEFCATCEPYVRAQDLRKLK